MRRARLAAASLLVAACGGANAEKAPAPPPIASAPAPSASSAESAMVDAGPPLPPEPSNVASIETPPNAACAFTGAWNARYSTMRAASGGAAYGMLGEGRVDAKLLPTGGLYVKATTGSLEVTGYVDSPDSYGVHAARALTFGGYVVGTAHAPIRVASDGGQLKASLVDSGWLVPVGGAPTAAVTCDDLGTTVQSFEARATLPGAQNDNLIWLLRAQDVPLATTAGGAPVARLRYANASVDVLERRGAQLRVVVNLLDRFVFGWIPSGGVRSLTPAQRTKEIQDELNRAELGVVASRAATPFQLDFDAPPNPADPPAIDELRCPTALRLVAESGSVRVLVGSVAAASVVRVLERGEALTRVALPAVTRGGFVRTSDATLFVPTRDLARCASQPITSEPAPPSPPLPGSVNIHPPARSDDPPPLNPSVRVVGWSLGGDPLKDVDAALRGTFTKLAKRCYWRGLDGDPKMEGTLDISLQVGRSGAVADGWFTRKSGLSDAVASCVLTAARGLRFTRGGTGGPSSVSFTVTFARSGRTGL